MTRTRTPLDSTAIAAAALRVVDRSGAAGFTIRAVATELGSSPMALYYHVSDRVALIELMTEVAFGEEQLSADPAAEWRDELWAIAEWFLAASLRHPALTAVARELGGAPTPTLEAVGARWFAAWQRSGLDPAAADDAAHASVAALTSIARGAPMDPRLFELALRSLIDGLHARLSDSR